MSQPIPQQPSFAPDALLKFTVQGHALTTNPVPPKLTIDGYAAATAAPGTTHIPIMSGRHQLKVSAWWLLRFGHAVLDVDIAPGETVEVFYATPHHQFVRQGSLGLTPQDRKGLVGLVTLLVVIMAVVFGLPTIWLLTG